jgi:hypothetical protein
VGQWENEGGARLVPVPATLIAPAVVMDSLVVHARQDEVMAVTSTDGRPPTHRRRVFEWRMFALGAGLIIVGCSIWVAVRGVSFFAVVAGLTMGVLLLVGASPVLGAGMLRGKEERAARQAVRLDRQGRRAL